MAAAQRRLHQITGHLSSSPPPPPAPAPVASTATAMAAVHNNSTAAAAELADGFKCDLKSLQTVYDTFQSAAKPKESVSVDQWKTKAGTEIGVSRYLKVEQERIDGFSITTMDPQWIHQRTAGENGSPFGAPIAHGFLVLSLCPVLMGDVLPSIDGAKMGVNYGVNKLRWVSPVKAGKSVRMRVKLISVESIKGGLQNTFGCSIEVEGQAQDKPACVLEWVTRVYL